MMRSIGAVVAGYAMFAISAVVFFQLTGRPPETWPGLSFATFGIVYGGVFAMAAGYLAAKLAPRAPFAHAGVIAVLLLLSSGLSLLVRPSGASLWTQASTLLVSAPSALLGGYLQRRQLAPG